MKKVQLLPDNYRTYNTILFKEVSLLPVYVSEWSDVCHHVTCRDFHSEISMGCSLWKGQFGTLSLAHTLKWLLCLCMVRLLRNFKNCPCVSCEVQKSEVPSGKTLCSAGGHRFHRSVLLMRLKKSPSSAALLGEASSVPVVFSPQIELLVLVF